MSNLSQFFGSGGAVKPAGLINGESVLGTVGVAAGVLTWGGSFLKSVTSGARTAGTLGTILSLAGKGAISFLACQGGDNVSRTHRIKLTIDGAVIFDATTIPVSSSSNVHFVLGSVAYAAPLLTVIPEVLIFDKSLVVEYATGVTETDKTVIAYRYFPR